MRIKTLSVGLGVEVVKADLQRAMNDLAAVGESLRPAKIGVDGSRVDMSGVADQASNLGDELAARLGSALSSVGGGIGRTIGALAPIADRTAGAIITGFRRIDAEINFPKAQAALKRIGDVMLKLSAVDVSRGSAKGWAEIASVSIEKVRAKTASLWGPGPIQRYWKDFEERGRAARQAFKDFENVPKARVGPGFGKRIAFAPKPTNQQAIDLKNYERAVFAVARLQKAFLAAKLGADVLRAGAGLAFGVAGDAARLSITPVTMLVGTYARVSAAVQRIKNNLGVFGDVAGKSFTKIFGLGKSLAQPFANAIAPTKAFTRTVQATTGVVGGLTASVRGFGVQLLAAFGVIGVVYKTVQFFKDGVKAASDLNETVNASKQVFGNAFGDVDATVSRISSRFGILRKDQLDAASGFGSIAKGAGATEGQAANLAIAFTNLAADFASFKNLSFEDAAAKLRSGLAGESEPLRRYGALLTEDAVKAKGFAMGLGTITGAGKGAKRELSDLEKIQARAALIMDKLKDSQGDLARTSGDAANQFRKAGGGIAEFQTRIGELLLPAVKAGTVAFNEFLAITLDVFGGMQPYFTSWMESAVSAFQTVGYAVRNAGAFWEIAKLKVYEFAINAGRWIMTLPENLANFASWLGTNWLNLLTDGLNAALAVFKNFGANLKALGAALGEWLANPTGGFSVDWTPLLDGFQATAAKLPDLIRPELYSVQGEVDKIMRGIQEKEAKRVKGIAMPAQQAATQAAETAKKGTPEVKLASAVEASSKEAYSAIVKTQTANDPARDAARVAKEGVGVQKQQLGVLNKIANQLGNQEGAPVFALGPA